MAKRKIDTIGKVCPFPVIVTLKEVNRLQDDDELEVLFDDPLALKSIPDELEPYDMDIDSERRKDHWKMRIKKRNKSGVNKWT